MNNDDVILSDLERNKELFEYEMTEVLIQLKDEFTKVNSKDFQLNEEQFDMPKINLEIKNPDLKITAHDVKISTLKISSVEFTAPEVKFNLKGVECSTVSEIQEIHSKAVELEDMNVNVPAIPSVDMRQIDNVDIDMPHISLVKSDVHISENKEDVKICSDFVNNA